MQQDTLSLNNSRNIKSKLDNQKTNTGTYDTDIKIVCDGLTASWYDITGTTLIDSITCTGTLDDGKTPFAFLTRGLPNGYDYNPQP